jgi:hypothetical protein
MVQARAWLGPAPVPRVLQVPVLVATGNLALLLNSNPKPEEMVKMRLLVVTQGEYGVRMLDNIRQNAPSTWTVEEWRAPAVLPAVMDYPEDFLPDALSPADLILSLGENPGVAELVPEIVKLTSAQAVIAPMDRLEWMPRGLARQLAGWLGKLNVEAVFPKPLCSLTETHYDVGRYRKEYHNKLIAEFARYFGRPRFVIQIDPETKTIVRAEAERDAVCGCARYVAGGLVGVHMDEAEFQSGMLHHHYPCLAAMGIDDDFADTLMHVSGNITRDEVKEQIRPYLTVQVFTPQGRVDELGTSEPVTPASP